jgi:hypothetical protein
MDGEPIPDEHHVVKYLGPSKWNEGDDPDWSALLPRLQDCGKSSCNWMEFYDSYSSDEERMEQIRKGIIDSNSLKLRTRGAFVKFRVGEACTKLQQEQRQVRFVHKPLGANLSHAEMEGLQHGDVVAGALLGGCVTANFPGLILT